MDDRVIDIGRYLGTDSDVEGPGAFSVLGGGGERSRFALPVWRAIYLVGGDWGGIVSLTPGEAGTEPEVFFALDLKKDPARSEVPTGSAARLLSEAVPSIAATREGGVAVLLGSDHEKAWFLLVLGQGAQYPSEGKPRETLLFLAGECAGLLFFRELAILSPSASSAP